MLRHTAAEAAIEDVIAALDGLPRAFQNDRRARGERFTEHADAADFRLGRGLADDPGDRRAVAEKIAPAAGDDFQFHPVLDHRDVVEQFESAERGMRSLHAGIENRDLHAAPASVANRDDGLLGSDPGFQRKSSRPRASETSWCSIIRARTDAASCSVSRFSTVKPGGSGCASSAACNCTAEITPRNSPAK